MAHDESDPLDHEERLRRRHRRPTLRASAAHTLETIRPEAPPADRADDTAPRLDLRRGDLPRESARSTMRIRSFRARAQSEFAAEQGLPPDLTRLIELVLGGARDRELAEALGTDELGLRDLERRFLLRVGRSVYVAAVEVVNRAARMRRETLG